MQVKRVIKNKTFFCLLKSKECGEFGIFLNGYPCHTLQLNTIWLEFADDLKRYRKEFIRTAYKSYNSRSLKSEIGKEIVTELEKKDAEMAQEVESFFVDIQECFDETYRILKPGGRCCYVIGNTVFKKKEHNYAA